MSGFVAYTFSDAQKTDIRRFCGFGAYGDGSVVFPFPWIMRQWLALEYRLQHISQAEGAVVVNTYLANLALLETDIVGARGTLNVASAGPFTRNANEVRERWKLFRDWRRELCRFLDIPPGPGLGEGGIQRAC